MFIWPWNLTGMIVWSTDGGESASPSSRHQLLLLKWLSSPHLSQAFIYIIQLSPQAYNLPDMNISSCCFLFDLEKKKRGRGLLHHCLFAAVHPNEKFWAATIPDFSSLLWWEHQWMQATNKSAQRGMWTAPQTHPHALKRQQSPTGQRLTSRCQAALTNLFQRSGRRGKRLIYWDTITLLGN